MGYLVACFYFLLFGGDLLLKPIRKILHYWDFLIAYNIFVITMKNILSVSNLWQTDYNTIIIIYIFNIKSDKPLKFENIICIVFTKQYKCEVLTDMLTVKMQYL